MARANWSTDHLVIGNGTDLSRFSLCFFQGSVDTLQPRATFFSTCGASLVAGMPHWSGEELQLPARRAARPLEMLFVDTPSEGLSSNLGKCWLWKSRSRLEIGGQLIAPGRLTASERNSTATNTCPTDTPRPC